MTSPSYNLAIANPALALEWHPTKNGSLIPRDVTPGSSKKIWWVCKLKHEWQATIKNRFKGSGCPTCYGRRRGVRIPNEEKILAKKNPSLAKEWDYKKNYPLTPFAVSYGSDLLVWWKCKKGHEWKARIANRMYGRKCPYCFGQAVNIDNCLQTINPQLSMQWHPTKNSPLTPKNVRANSQNKAWWVCDKGHEWKAVVSSRNKIWGRNKGAGCPYCSAKKVNVENCLETINPKLAQEWHPTKNAKLSPQDVTSGSEKKVWWLCNRGHEWEAVVFNRNKGIGCPYCHNKTSKLTIRLYAEFKFLFNDVRHRIKKYGLECDIYIPSLKFAIETDGYYWHKNKYIEDQNKTRFLERKGIFVLRVREDGLKKISNHDIYYHSDEANPKLVHDVLDKILQNADLVDDVRKQILDYKSKTSFANDKEYFSLINMLPSPFPGQSLADKNPSLAREWCLKRNGKLTPQDVWPNSNIKVWWVCSKGHEWTATVNNRTSGYGCPYCAGQKVCEDNCLQTRNPDLAEEWHPTKNGILTPQKVMPNTKQKIWWKCERGHEWMATVNSRNRGCGCPYCSGQRVNNKNCLMRKNPILAKEWHPTKNGNQNPSNVMPNSNKKVWWLCARKHEWEASISSRNKGSGCPICRKATDSYNLMVVNPSLSREWHLTKNFPLTPKDVTPGSNKKVWWICDRGHTWNARINSRNCGKGCPYCAGKK